MTATNLVSRAVTSTAAVIMHIMYMAHPTTTAFQFAALGYISAIWVIVGSERTK